METTLDSLLQDASAFIEEEFGLGVDESGLKLYSAENWSHFCEANGFDAGSEGIYVPKSHTAYAKTDSDVLLSNIFHEYFGHGLFCEYSSIGKTLVEIEQKGGDAHSYLYGEINQVTQPLGLMRRNLGNYEGFALWMEALLCEETGNSEVWERKKERLSQEDTMLFEYFKEAEQKLTRSSFMAQLGFPKEYGGNTVIDFP